MGRMPRSAPARAASLIRSMKVVLGFSFLRDRALCPNAGAHGDASALRPASGAPPLNPGGRLVPGRMGGPAQGRERRSPEFSRQEDSWRWLRIHATGLTVSMVAQYLF